MSTTKRIALALLVATMFGTAACADSTGPRNDTTCTETQGTGGRCH
ncbi:MAG TPA: hypothetical protein VGP80_07290 [Gemmatimonadales bacterium]|jgi:hypothetical protein|nr:hypothetical protein [Gemmatimonadales bacterium]